MGCLYKLTSPSGKSYIGISSKTMDARWAKHVEHACGKRDAGALYAALRKYGPDSFARAVIAESEDWDTLRRLEIEAIKSHGTLAPDGYNITQGGEGTRNRLSAEARANISRAQKLRYQRPSERERLLVIGQMARAKTSAAAVIRRAKKRAARQEYVASPEFKAMRSKRIKDSMASPESKERMRAAAKSRAADPVWKARMIASKTGVKLPPCSDQRKRLIAEARRREWADPVIREKRLAAFANARAAKKSEAQAGDE